MARSLALGLVLLALAGTIGGKAGARGPGDVVEPAPPLSAGTSGAPQEALLPDEVGAGLVARSAYRWPTGGPVAVVRRFAAPVRRWAAGHRGVDLALPAGAPVAAAAAGTVAFAGPVAGRPVVAVVHPDGVRTTYEPVVPVVRPGQPVVAGEVLGHLGAPTHCDPDACLHWGARRGPDAYLDPLLLLVDRRVRLYPVG